MMNFAKIWIGWWYKTERWLVLCFLVPYLQPTCLYHLLVSKKVSLYDKCIQFVSAETDSVFFDCMPASSSGGGYILSRFGCPESGLYSKCIITQSTNILYNQKCFKFQFFIFGEKQWFCNMRICAFPLRTCKKYILLVSMQNLANELHLTSEIEQNLNVDKHVRFYSTELQIDQEDMLHVPEKAGYDKKCALL